MITNVLYATLYVSDQDKALAFYRDTLGLEVRADYSGPEGRFLTVGVPGASVEFVLWPAHGVRPFADADAEPGVVPGPVVLETGDLKAVFDDLASKGVAFEEPAPVVYPFGVRATALDPDGNRISLRQRRTPERSS